MVLTITIFQFAPVTVSATTTLQQRNKIVNITTDTSLNPNTGDNIMIYISMLGLSVIGLIGTGIYLRKNGLN